MKVKMLIHEAEEGGYWAEVPALPGVVSQGETIPELISNMYEAVEGALSVDLETVELGIHDQWMELAV